MQEAAGQGSSAMQDAAVQCRRQQCSAGRSPPGCRCPAAPGAFPAGPAGPGCSGAGRDARTAALLHPGELCPGCQAEPLGCFL